MRCLVLVVALIAAPCLARAQCVPSYEASDDLRWASPSERMREHAEREAERMERTVMRGVETNGAIEPLTARSAYTAEAWREAARATRSPARAMVLRQRAESHLDEILRAEPTHELALFTLAAVQSDDGRPDHARRTLELLLAVAPAGPFAPYAWARLGDHALEGHHTVEAIGHFTRALENAPALLRAYVLYRTAWAMRMRGDATGATQSFERAATELEAAPASRDHVALARAIELERPRTDACGLPSLGPDLRPLRYDRDGLAAITRP
ncbi:Hypothetical protein I5071_32400 [Sandaracinus amylolyticus]|nr:Hypothetical protein I5071_32400 [Sandaracinus amylolyticus]